MQILLLNKYSMPGEKFVLSTKRISNDLPYYYFTSAHDRFYKGPRPSFNKPPRKSREKRLPQREQVGLALVRSGTASLPVRGTLAVRAQFHKQPVPIPPPSTAATHTTEHSYFK